MFQNLKMHNPIKKSLEHNIKNRGVGTAEKYTVESLLFVGD